MTSLRFPLIAAALLATVASTSAFAQNRQLGAEAVLERFDKNDDGVIQKSEAPRGLAQRFDRFDQDEDGTLTGEELAAVAERMSQRRKPWARHGRPGRRPGEINAPPALAERDEEQLDLGDTAPDFTLPLARGEGEITLSDYAEDKPVVLVFGSLTCPPFRDRMLQVQPLYQKYRDVANFLMVYTREAHPESTIYIQKDGQEVLEKIEQTDDFGQRRQYAAYCGTTLKYTFPTVVDREDNRVKEAYAGWPSRFYVVDTAQSIVYDGGPGPRGFQPAELDKWLQQNLR